MGTRNFAMIRIRGIAVTVMITALSASCPERARHDAADGTLLWHSVSATADCLPGSRTPAAAPGDAAVTVTRIRSGRPIRHILNLF